MFQMFLRTSTGSLDRERKDTASRPFISPDRAVSAEVKSAS